jgi:pimeloyl-ACP methyl ester carboxylesterase
MPATFVLVHGAWFGGWSWKKIAPRLRAAGHEVYTPTLTGLGERSHLFTPEVDLDTHIKDVAAVLEFEDLTDVVLVGHSYAGMVIAGMAQKAAPRLAELVYMDAFFPEDAKSVNDYSPKPHPSVDGRVKPLDPRVAFGITDERDIAWMAQRLRDQPAKTLSQPVRLSAATSVRQTYIQCHSRRAYFYEAAGRATRQGLRLVEMASAGHLPMVTMPNELVSSLLALV